MHSLDVIGLGALNIDHLYQVERILLDGEAPLEGHVSAPGGSAANTIYALAKLGVEAGFVGAVGDDEVGRMLAQDLASVGVDIGQIKVKRDAPTGSVLCLSDRRGRRALYASPGANSLLGREDIELARIKARIVHLSSFVHQGQLELAIDLLGELVPTIKVSFAPGALYAARGLQALAPILKRTDILFVNRDELRQLTGQDFSPGARRLLEQGCHTVVVTMGGGKKRGTTPACYVLSGERAYLVEPQRAGTEMVEATGAGDAFAAGFLYGLIEGKGPEECGFLGDIVAGFSMSRLGARAGLPTQAQLSQRYRELYGKPL